MAAEGRKVGLYDLSNVVAFGHNEQWRPKAVKMATTKLDKIPLSVYYNQSVLHPLCCGRARSRSRGLLRGVPAYLLTYRGEDATNGPV